MMFEEEDLGKKPAGLKNLEPISLDELDNYIDELKAEIVRVEEEKARKKTHMDAASSVFK